MGLYDRDYMREKPARDREVQSVLNRQHFRRRWPVVLGVVLLLAVMIAFLSAK